MRSLATRAQANLALFEHIDECEEPRRSQGRVGWLRPNEFEEKRCADQAAAE
ncbi:hypothetical protein ACFC0M_28100 [Streptomyces sp. NPDC056149]|uniref:hypothetical protein n=1 Tax=Streptomyces sp. NPDC056149 TaxID=3345728 RepID=UPI0035D84457